MQPADILYLIGAPDRLMKARALQLNAAGQRTLPEHGRADDWGCAAAAT